MRPGWILTLAAPLALVLPLGASAEILVALEKPVADCGQ